MTAKKHPPGRHRDDENIPPPPKSALVAELKKNYILILVVLIVGAYLYWDNMPRQMTLPNLSAVTVMNISPLPQKLVNFSINNANDQMVGLENFYGRPRIIAFYRPECAECWPTLRTLDDLNFLMKGKIDVIPVALTTLATKQASQITRNYSQQKIRTLKPFNIEQSAGMAFVGLDPLPKVLLVDKNGDLVSYTAGPAAWHMPDMLEFLAPVLDGTYVFPKFRKK